MYNYPSDEIPFNLPLIDYVCHQHKLAKQQYFEGYKILAVQHLLGQTVPFLEAFHQGGAKPSDIYVVGKAYSSHPAVAETLMNKGYTLKFSDIFDCSLSTPYDTVLEHNIMDTLENIVKNLGAKKCLVIDDGGKAIKQIHQKYSQLANRFVCVEQTSRGARLVNTLSLQCPVINVARSSAKTKIESPMIARSMIKGFTESLQRWEEKKCFRLEGKSVLLLGFGFIGKEVAMLLEKQGFHLRIFDPNQEVNKEIALAGYQSVSDLRSTLKTADVIIGATGTEVLHVSDYRSMKKNTLLVNMASTDTEFSSWKWRVIGDAVEENLLPSDRKYLQTYFPLPWRTLYHVEDGETQFYLANGGFPANFYGSVNPVPTSEIQLTSALLLGGAIQAAQASHAIFYDLDKELQDGIIAAYNEIINSAQA